MDDSQRREGNEPSTSSSGILFQNPKEKNAERTPRQALATFSFEAPWQRGNGSSAPFTPGPLIFPVRSRKDGHDGWSSPLRESGLTRSAEGVNP